MGRGRQFSGVEIDIIVENFNSGLRGVVAAMQAAGYNRSPKSIARKIEKLREAGVVGLRTGKIKRNRSAKKLQEPRSGGDTGATWGSADWGSSSWGSPDWETND